MNAVVLAWLLSLAGAALFFTAGVLFQMLRAAQPERSALDRERIRTVLTELAHFMRRRITDPVSKRARRLTLTLLALVRQRRRSGWPQEDGGRVVGARGAAFRSMLDQETRGNGFAGAVIADELGLVVASTGEYGDALAAYGAYLAGVGAKTRDGLPLRSLRHVIVQDDHDMTLTVRPIASADDNLALVTLAAGPNAVMARANQSSLARETARFDTER